MGADKFEITITIVKLIGIFLLMVQMVPLLVWVERRGSAFIQNRFGPNRVGPLGLMQLLADAVKFIFKEEFFPSGSKAILYYAAPVIALVPAALSFASIPLSVPIRLEQFTMLGKQLGPYEIISQGFQVEIGVLFVFGVSSLAAYSLLLAGWSSNSKYSLLGALRASAQMISYELSMGLSVVGCILIYGSLNFNEIIKFQFDHEWGIIYQPLAFILFFTAAFAESNRLPFDLPEAEGELVVGYHTEYGGFKMLMFYIGEYGHMMVSSALIITLFLGGYYLPGMNPETTYQHTLASYGSPNTASILTALIYFLIFFAKLLFLLWIFVWIRWTLPRFKYDRLMDLGWKTMLPWSIANTVVTAVVVFFIRR